MLLSKSTPASLDRLMAMATNTLGSTRMTNSMGKAPTPLPMAKNTSVSTRTESTTAKAPTLMAQILSGQVTNTLGGS